MKLLLENWRKFLKEDTEPYPYQIYCDMDGVLVGYEKGVVEMINQRLVAYLENPDPNYEFYKQIERLRRALDDAMRLPEEGITADDISMTTQPRTELIIAARDYMYRLAENDPQFWANLPWREGGRELWDYIRKITAGGPAPIILTKPIKDPSSGGRPLTPSEEGKAIWVKTHLGAPTPTVLFSKTKFEYATTDGYPNILIDDLEKNVKNWLAPEEPEKTGGFAIQHKNFADTKADLEYIATIPREKSAT